MKQNVERILKMVEEKKITAEEAVRLLDSLKQQSESAETNEKEEYFNEEPKKEEYCFKDELENGFKKLEKGFKKLEPKVEKTVKEALVKISEVTKDLSEKFDKEDNKDVEDMYEDMFDDLEK